MNQTWCQKRMRIRVPGLGQNQIGATWERLLGMVDGVLQVRTNPRSERVLVEYDDRKIEAWQLSALAARLKDQHQNLAPATYALNRHKIYLLFPIGLVAGVLTRRLLFGRSQIADNLLIFETATLVSVFSGYPPLRNRVQSVARRAQISDDMIFTSAALFLAVLRESYLVFAALFLLSYNSYRRRSNTLAAAAKAGEAIARMDHENIEPHLVARYAKGLSTIGITLSAIAAVVYRKPVLASTLLLAANPRPALISARYSLNHFETLTHEDCTYIPIHTGMDLYDLARATKLVILSDQPESVDHFGQLSVRYMTAAEAYEVFKGFNTERQADVAIRRIILISPNEDPLTLHQRQGDTMVLRGNMMQLENTINLSHQLRRHVKRQTIAGAGFNLAAITSTLRGMKAFRVNFWSDAFVLLLLGLPSVLFPGKQAPVAREPK